jgi:LmbE family N-acetylglucosaminyl deacetylase
MKRKILIFLIVVFFTFNICGSKNIVKGGEIVFNKNDTVLIVAPHPDDEVLANTKVMIDALKNGSQVYVVFVTSGEHNTDTMLKFAPIPIISSYLFAYRRYREAIASEKIIGVTSDHLIFLGFPDFGMMKILTNPNKDYFSGITLRKKVFESWSIDKGKPYNLTIAYTALKDVFLKVKPTKVFYPSPYDLNPDHRAVSVLTQAVLKEINNPGIQTFTYFVHAKGYPNPLGYFPTRTLNFPNFFMIKPEGTFYNLDLERSDISKKYKAVKAHKSQYLTKPKFMLSFVRRNEVFFVENPLKLNMQLPLWDKSIMSKLGMTPFVEKAKIGADSKHYDIQFTLFKGTPRFSKINIFLYPVKSGSEFLNMPKYRIEIERDFSNKLALKLFDKDKEVFTTFENLSGSSTELDFDIKINKSYFDGADCLFLMFSFEQFDVRVTETPWFCIDILN